MNVELPATHSFVIPLSAPLMPHSLFIFGVLIIIWFVLSSDIEIFPSKKREKKYFFNLLHTTHAHTHTQHITRHRNELKHNKRCKY